MCLGLKIEKEKIEKKELIPEKIKGKSLGIALDYLSSLSSQTRAASSKSCKLSVRATRKVGRTLSGCPRLDDHRFYHFSVLVLNPFLMVDHLALLIFNKFWLSIGVQDVVGIGC